MFRITGDFEKAPILEALIDHFGDDETMIINEAVQFFFLGFHGIGINIIWIFYYLSIHQDIQEKVLDEINEAMGDKKVVDQEVMDQLRYDWSITT